MVGLTDVELFTLRRIRSEEEGTEHLYAKRIRALHTYTPTALKGNTPTDKTLKTPSILDFVRV